MTLESGKPGLDPQLYVLGQLFNFFKPQFPSLCYGDNLMTQVPLLEWFWLQINSHITILKTIGASNCFTPGLTTSVFIHSRDLGSRRTILLAFCSISKGLERFQTPHLTNNHQEGKQGRGGGGGLLLLYRGRNSFPWFPLQRSIT